MNYLSIDRQGDTSYFPLMRILAAILFLCFFTAITSNAEDEPFSLLGVEIPTIETDQWLLETDTIPFTANPLKFDLLFYLSSEGLVDSFSFSPQTRVEYVEKISNSLENIRFYPARYKGKSIPFIFPAQLIFKKKRSKQHVELNFPFYEPDCIKSGFELRKCLKLNGFTLPDIKRFPSYFLKFEGIQEKFNYPFSIYEIKLDSSGLVDDFTQIYNYGGDFSRVLNKSIMYADFIPAAYNEIRFDSKFYLIFRLFNTIIYPTSIWPPEETTAGYPLEYLRLEPVLYLDSLINPPIPLNAPGGEYKSDLMVSIKETIELRIKIGINGEIKSSKIISKANNYLQNSYKEVIGKMQFIPARDISNNRREYEGNITLQFNNSKTVKIFPAWLPQSPIGF